METKKIEFKIRRATKRDIMNEANTDLKVGTIFFCDSVETPGRICGPYRISEDHDITDRREFASWYRQQRIWVPICSLDNEISIITENS